PQPRPAPAPPPPPARHTTSRAPPPRPHPPRGGAHRSQSVRALRAYLPRLLDAGYFVSVPEPKYT
ncbi:hypothetical protein ACFWYS_46600, partial [Streptomyces sp. NPDC059010]